MKPASYSSSMPAALALALSIALVFSPAAGFAAQAEPSLWSPLPKLGTTEGQRLTLDEAGLRLRLGLLDDRADRPARASVTLRIPVPDGTFQTFSVTPSRTMAEPLARRFPELRTYKGVALDGLPRTLRFELTPAGFDAMLFGPDGTSVIRPAGSKSQYESLFRDHLQDSAQRGFLCGFDPQQHGVASRPVPAPSFRKRASAKLAGSSVRVYRTAISATKEFTAANGGSVAGAMAEIVSAVNRINQPFENDLGVAVELVADNDRLIFTAANPGNFDDSSAGQSAMLDQNQVLLDSEIGAANYDLGHVFGTSGGGLASIGPCNAQSKAQGYTGQDGLSGDPFWIDYVAHEFGHQFGADHTYNDEGTGGCTTRVPESAFEPASGSTIMSYVGICGALGAANLQSSADAYYHVRSLEQIHAYTQNVNEGAACGAPRATGNQPPQLVAVTTARTIPARTPFALTAAATDPDGDPVTYTWEQYDLGAASPPVTDDGARPLFRSFTPTSTPTRFFPRMADTLAGTQTFGELLPQTSRTLTFRVIVRDHKLGGGGVEWSGSDTSVGFPATTLTVVDTGAPFAVTSQAQAEVLTAGDALTVVWNVAGTSAAPINCSNVRLDWSANGGQSFSAVTASTPNDGSEVITIPGPATPNARLRVQCVDNVFFAINAADLNVTGGNADPVFRNGFEGQP